MFGSIGVVEIMIIAAVGLMILGPEKFPEVARMFARIVKDLRGYVDEAKTEIVKEIRPLQNELREVSRVDAKRYIEKIVDEDDDSPPNPEPEGPDPDYNDFYNPYQDEYPGMPPDETIAQPPAVSEQAEAGQPEESTPGTVEYGQAEQEQAPEDSGSEPAGEAERKPLDG